MSSEFRSSCYWTDWNWANTENIRIGLVFAVLAQWKFLYCIDRFDHIKANKSKLINNIELSHILLQYVRFCMSNNSWKTVLVICPLGKYPYLPSNIHICPHISVFAPEFNFRYLRSGLKVQGKMMHGNMYKIVFQSN